MFHLEIYTHRFFVFSMLSIKDSLIVKAKLRNHHNFVGTLRIFQKTLPGNSDRSEWNLQICGCGVVQIAYDPPPSLSNGLQICGWWDVWGLVGWEGGWELGWIAIHHIRHFFVRRSKKRGLAVQRKKKNSWTVVWCPVFDITSPSCCSMFNYLADLTWSRIQELIPAQV